MSTISRRKLASYTADRLIAGDDVKVVMRELGAHLIETGRIREQELIVRDIERQLAARGVVAVTATTARQLTAAAKQALEAMVRAEYDNAKKVSFHEVIDESVIGGVRLEMPGKQLDATVKVKLEKLVVER